MKKILTMVALFVMWQAAIIAVVLFEQQASAQSQDRVFTLMIPEAQLNYIGKVIGRQPYEEARPVLEGIQAQVNAQLTRERDAERDRLKSELSKGDKQP